MARKKLGQFLSTQNVDPTPNRIDYVVDPSGSPSPSEGFAGGSSKIVDEDDLGIDPNTNIELKTLLNDWVRYIQSNAQAVFGVGPNVETNVEIIRGQPLSHADQHDANVFIQTSTSATTSVTIPGASSASPIDTSHLAPTLSRWSNSGKFDDSVGSSGFNSSPQTLGEFLDKTKSIDGHYLLAEVAGNDNQNLTGKTFLDVDESNINSAVKKSYEILKKYNIFNPNTAVDDGGHAFSSDSASIYVDPEADEEELVRSIDARAFSSVQAGFGKNFKTGEDPTYEKDIKFEQLKKIAIDMMVKSSGFAGMDVDFLASDLAVPDEDLTTSQRIERHMYRSRMASNAFETGGSLRLGRGEFNQQKGPEIESSKSYGTISSPDAPFQSRVTVARAAAAIIAIKSAMSILDDGVKSMSVGKQMILGRGPLLLGSSNLKKNPGTRMIMSSLLVPTTQQTYSKCVDFGAKILLGDGWKENSAEKLRNNSENGTMRLSAGYYHSVARSVLRSIDRLNNALSLTEEDGVDVNSILASTGAVGFMNTLATIGNIGYMRTGGSGSVKNAATSKGPFDVDKMADGPGTRVGKSRTQDGFNQNALSMRTSATPSLYILPKNIIRASMKMATLGIGTNPARGMLGSSLGPKTYLDKNMEDGNSRIPNDVVERIENLLDAEYCPFYFHDLRTNEIVAFNAFLENLSDSFNPKFNAVSGYGRIDPVQIYQNTTRNLSFDFHIASTSQEDFDEMWFKINKLVTLVYPQWTEGTKVKAETDAGTYEFTQPFSQVIGATPLVRLRIGDVIKSNYSKFHLSRIFGMGNQDTSIPDEGGGPLALAGAFGLEEFFMEAFYAIYGSPLQYIQIDGKPDLTRALRGAASALLTNGFANPLWNVAVGRLLRDPDVAINPAPWNITLGAVGDNVLGPNGAMMQGIQGGSGKGFGYHNMCIVFIKATMGQGYTTTGGTEYRFDRPVRCLVTGRTTVDIQDINNANTSPGTRGAESYATRGSARRQMYEVMVIDFATSADIFGEKFLVTHSDLIADPDFIYNLYVAPVIDPAAAIATGVQAIINEVALIAGVPTDTVQLTESPEAAFMNANNNAIVKSFNMMKGRGLAGVVTKLTFTLLDDQVTWETDWNSRAPKVVKVSMAFDVIHDLPPGLGHDGFNRAPIYNVGRIMSSVAGDPYDDNGSGSKMTFSAEGRKTVRKTGKIPDKKQGKVDK